MTETPTTSGATQPSAAMTTTPTEATDRVLNSAMLIFGITGSGKTSLLVTLMEYVWTRWRKVSLLYLTDGGGIPPHLQALVNRGIVRIWRMRTRSGYRLAFETCQRASQGYWPAKINPKTGEVDPHVRLVAPLTTSYVASCPAGHVVKTGPTVASIQIPVAGLACPVCKTHVTPQTVVTSSRTTRTKGFEQVGAVFFDGLSSQCTWMMDDLGERAGKNELGGEKGNLNTVHSGDLSFGATNRGAYGLVQTRMEQMVLNSTGIPDLVVPPVWTALTLELSDEGGLPVRGPLVIGQAKTTTIGEKFGDTLEAIVVKREGKNFRQLHTQQWIDEKGVRHLAQIRSFPGQIPAVLEDEEVGQGTETNPGPSQPFEKFSLAHFYELRQAAKVAAEARINAQYADAPGLPEGDMEYGEGASTTSGTTPAAGSPSPGVSTGAGLPSSASPSPAALSPAQLAQQRQRAAATPATPAPAPAPTTSTPPAPAAPAVANAAPVSVPAVVPAAAVPAPSTPTRAAAVAPAVAPASPMATGPVPAAPKPPAPPVRGPVAPPPGRRPVS